MPTDEEIREYEASMASEHARNWRERLQLVHWGGWHHFRHGSLWFDGKLLCQW